MRNALPAFFRLFGTFFVLCVTAMSLALTPINLKCEYQNRPLGVDTLHPRLAWWFESSRRAEVQTAYQIQVASSKSNLESGVVDLWDSGKVASDQSVHVEYAGIKLKSNMACFWRVRVWDRDGKASRWSQTSKWTTGLFRSEDWMGKWIAATSEHSYTRTPSMFGYHARESKIQDATKWVQVDLGAPHKISEVVLYSPNPPGFDPSGGFGFPIRFKVEASDDPGFLKSTVLANHLDQDFPNPAGTPVKITGGDIPGRYIRVTATKLWNRQTGPEPYCFALAELEVISGGKNIALHAPVSSFDSVEVNDWNQKRLTDEEYLRDRTVGEKGPENGAVFLQKSVQISKTVVRATAFLCGLGYSELMINGKKVGDHVLDPGFTDYSKRALYVTHDVTKQLRNGKNDVGILLGGGWFNLATADLFSFEKAPWSASPRARFHLKIEFSDGSSKTIVSDESWQWSPTAITFNCVRGGETIDARFDSKTRKPVMTVEAPQGKLVSQQQPPIRVTATIKPIAMTEPKPGVYVFDLGTNIAGWATLRTKGARGTRVTMKYNEALSADGTANMQHTASHTYGRFQTDECILSGKLDFFEPRFTYHGFRYVEVTGLTEKPTLNSLEGKWVTTDPERVGNFECSNERLNKVQDLIVHAYLNNLHSIPTDCPQREKMGWMDDGCVDMETGFFNLDTAQFYRKWFNDMMDAQDANGHVTDIVPTSGWGRTRADGSPGEMADPWWGGAIVFTPWKLYQKFGDRRVIQEGYPAMKAYVDYLSSTAKGNVVSWGLGDWLDDSAGGGGRRVPVAQTSTAAYFYAASIVADSAKLLGKKSDEEKYRVLATTIRLAYEANFLNEKTGLYANDSQTAQALPLTLDLTNPESKPKVLEQLVASIEGARKGHISAGMVGSLYVFHALTENGRDDLAYKMLTQETYPGWLHMINSGATSLWEAWNGDGSYNHPTLGCVGFWLYEGLAGIKPDPTAPGYQKFVVKPSVDNDLTWVTAHYDSVHGRIKSSWHREGKKLTFNLTIPPNTSATVFIPCKETERIFESGKPIEEESLIRYLGDNNGYTSYKIGSGSYSFVSTIN